MVAVGVFITTKSIFFIAGCCVFGIANHVPQFSREINVINVPEEEPIGTHLLNVVATDADGDAIEYSLEGDNIEYLDIDHRSGDITTARIIDREKFTRLQFRVIAAEVKDPTQKSVQDVVIHVINKNDNAPIFTKDYYTVNVSENTLGNKYITQVSATDADEDELMYSVTNGNEFSFFTIDVYSGTITTTKKLDYEIQSKFKIEVTVADGRVSDLERHLAKTFVYIRIIDEDDNSAVFNKNYSTSIVEGTYKDEQLLQVHAEDLDSGVKAQIRYSIDKSPNADVFSIDENGYVYVTGIIDREKVSQYKLTLLADEVTKDPSRFKRNPGRATLTVDVTDTDDNKPVFVQEKYVAHVKEHAVIDTPVLKVTARDADEGENAQFQYEIEDKNDAFRVTQDGTITVAKDLDREMNYLYGITVIARSLKNAKDFASCSVEVIIDDINDHNPRFSQNKYTATIMENMPIGSAVRTVLATDLDKAENARIRYSFVEDAEENSRKFHIHPISGKITTKVILDREQKSEYSILIKATDTIGHLDKQRRSTAKIKIYVLDANDNHPIFKQVDFFKNLHYDEPLNTPVAKVEATDLDANRFGRVSYRIVDGNGLKRFQIDTETGQVKVGDALAKFQGKYRLKVEAFDNNGIYPSLKSNRQAEVVITVDKNGENSVVLVMFAKVTDVIANQREILNDLEDLLSMGIVVDHIEKGDTADSTHFLIHGYNQDNYAVVKKDAVIRAFYRTSTAEMKNFRDRWNITTWHAQKLTDSKARSAIGKKTEKWQPVIWAILGFSALVAMFGMFGIIYLIKSRRRHYDESGASLTSSRVPIAPSRKTEFWNDDKFESVSQVPDSYVHSSGFLEAACDKYELDPSNLYNHSDTHLYEQDPFIDAERTSSSCSSESRASSRFAASSVVTTVCRSPNNISTRHSVPPKRSKPKCRDKRTGTIDRLGRERRLSIIEDDDGKTRSDLTTKIKRPPSYEYDLDEKLPDKAPYYEQV